MADNNATPGAANAGRGKKHIDIAELESRVTRLELEAREFEARNKIHQGKILWEKNKAENVLKGKGGKQA